MEIRHLSFGYGKKEVLHDLSLSFQTGKITTLLGANGSGKSTLFNICTRNFRLKRGIITLNGENIFHMKRRDFAKEVAIVHQQNRISGNISVRELVNYGRTPYIRMMQRLGEADRQAVDWALEVTNLDHLQNQPVIALSGGQRQRVWIAMALAQQSKMIFLDEPTTYLDIRYQVELLQLIRSLNREHGLSIVMVLHDINQALAYSDRLIGLQEGRILFDGEPLQVITSEAISTLYGIPLDVQYLKGQPHVCI